MATNIKLVRFITGEELLGEVHSESQTHLVLKKPIRVIVVPSKTDPNTPTVGFAPLSQFTADEVFEFQKAHILLVMEPIKEFINQYNQMFGGIVVPNSGKLIIPGM